MIKCTNFKRTVFPSNKNNQNRFKFHKKQKKNRSQRVFLKVVVLWESSCYVEDNEAETPQSELLFKKFT